MGIKRIVGIDFGTSTSVIRVKRYQDGKPVGEPLETQEVIFGGIGGMTPTLIQKKNGDDSVVYYGHEAQQKRKNMTLYHSFKVDLESSDPEKRENARNLTKEFFMFMAEKYKEQSSGGHLGNPDDEEQTIVSYPVKWSEETKTFMKQTAKEAGFKNVTGMDEAEAAIHAVTVMNSDHLLKNHLLQDGVPATILLIDMGAGTTDLVLCRYTPGDNPKAEILNTWPKEGNVLFGGHEIDKLLQNYFRGMMSEDDAEAVLKRVGEDKFKSWKEESVSPALMKKDSVSDFSALDTIVDALEIEMDEYNLDRKAFERCLGEYLKQLPELVNGCITDAGITGDQIDLVITTGGHSQWYFVKEMLCGKMPEFGEIDLPNIKENPFRVIPITRPQETVALGLAFSQMKVEFEKTVEHKLIVFSINDTICNNGHISVKCEQWTEEEIFDGQEFAVFDDGKIIGYCKVKCINDNKLLLNEFTGEINDDMDIDFLISTPISEEQFDDALIACEEYGCYSTTVSYSYEDPDANLKPDDEYFFYVTKVTDGEIHGRSLVGKIDDNHMEQYVYHNGFKQKLNWKRHHATGHNAIFEADTSNVHVGDIITDCILPNGYTFKCDQVSLRRYKLTFAVVEKANSSSSDSSEIMMPSDFMRNSFLMVTGWASNENGGLSITGVVRNGTVKIGDKVCILNHNGTSIINTANVIDINIGKTHYEKYSYGDSAYALLDIVLDSGNKTAISDGNLIVSAQYAAEITHECHGYLNTFVFEYLMKHKNVIEEINCGYCCKSGFANVEALRDSLQIPYDAHIFSIQDYGFIKRGKTGYALTDKGIYTKDSIYGKHYISWFEYAVNRLNFKIGIGLSYHTKQISLFSIDDKYRDETIALWEDLHSELHNLLFGGNH